MANWNTTEAIESLAAEIGDKVYIDIAKWHLYLNDAHLHAVLAEQFYPLLADNNLHLRTVLSSPPSLKRSGFGMRRPNLLQDKG
ncbi:MAG: DUF3181 family protein [Hormoscilla sp. SP5CHS1]|nr:DUF3181 family protein [Hormoscilla sp. SP12CHS1]MBC6455720.1 DUF3181 family protein [Hormoscilla sp. SP5CHS1]